MVEHLYGTATPTASTDPAMSAPPTKPQPPAVRPRRPPPRAPSMVRRGVAGSSPEEGSAKAPEIGAFSFRRTCSSLNVRWVWSRSWSFRVGEQCTRPANTHSRAAAPASTAPAVVAHFTLYPMSLFTDQCHLARQLDRTLWPLFHLLRGHGALCLQLEHLALLDHREPPRSTNGSRNLVQTPSQFGGLPASPPWH
jgi:hypothetical protein